MRDVLSAIVTQRRVVEKHPFFTWLHAGAVPLADTFAFSPLMVDFIMGFSDMNKWFLRYAEPRNELERGINEHTREDQTHSRIFIEDWHKLALDAQLCWTAGQTLWWLFNCERTDAFRSYGMETLSMAARNPNPLVRFAMMEAIEVCGGVFFTHTSEVAVALEKKTGLEYRYYGVYHQRLETGHLHTDEKRFTTATLSEADRAAALTLVDRVFAIFLEELDHLLDFSERFTRGGAGFTASLLEAREADLARRGGSPARWPLSPQPKAPSESQRPLVDHLAQRQRALEKNAFLEWLATNGPVAPLDTLRGFAPVWALDIVGYKDFSEKVLSYPAPTTTAERAINRWTTELATHGTLYLSDWQNLGLDDQLHWGPCETIAFVFLSRLTEVHRRNMAKVKHLAFKHDDPVLRYWLIYSLEAAGEPLFAATKPIAEQAERDIGRPLDYFAHRHYLAHRERPADPESDAVDFTSVPLSPEKVAIAQEIIDTIFDNLEEQLTLSRQIAMNDMLEVTGEGSPQSRVQNWVHSLVNSRRSGG